MPAPTEVVREGRVCAFAWGTLDPDLRGQLREGGRRPLCELAASLHGRTSGVYFLLLHDEECHETAFFVDQFSCRKIFVYAQDRTLHFAARLSRLAASGVLRPEVDLATVGTFLMYDYVPTNHTLLRGVTSLAAFTWYHFRDGRLAATRAWPFSPPQPSGDYQRTLHETFGRLEQAVLSGTRDADSLIVPLSGGRDSRLLLGLARKNRKQAITTFTFGQPGTLDYEIGNGLAHRLGLPHACCAIGRGFYRDHVVPSTPFLNGLTNHMLSPGNFLSQQFQAAPGQAVLSGYIGDLVLGGKRGSIPVLLQEGVRYPAPKQMALDRVLQLLPQARGPLLERLGELQRGLADVCEGDAISVEAWFYRIRVTTFTVAALFSERDEQFRFLVPFVNLDFLRWMFSIPGEVKTGPAFYRDLVGLDPGIAALFRYPLKNLDGAGYFRGPLANALTRGRLAWIAGLRGVPPKQNYARCERFYPAAFIEGETFGDARLGDLLDRRGRPEIYGSLSYEQKTLLLSLKLHLDVLLPGAAGSPPAAGPGA